MPDSTRTLTLQPLLEEAPPPFVPYREQINQLADALARRLNNPEQYNGVDLTTPQNLIIRKVQNGYEISDEGCFNQQQRISVAMTIEDLNIEVGKWAKKGQS